MQLKITIIILPSMRAMGYSPNRIIKNRFPFNNQQSFLSTRWTSLNKRSTSPYRNTTLLTNTTSTLPAIPTHQHSTTTSTITSTMILPTNTLIEDPRMMTIGITSPKSGMSNSHDSSIRMISLLKCVKSWVVSTSKAVTLETNLNPNMWISPNFTNSPQRSRLFVCLLNTWHGRKWGKSSPKSTPSWCDRSS